MSDQMKNVDRIGVAKEPKAFTIGACRGSIHRNKKGFCQNKLMWNEDIKAISEEYKWLVL